MNLELDPERRYILDILWHCFNNWLSHFERLDEAAQVSSNWDSYRLTAQCFDPAAKGFGSVHPSDVQNVSLGVDDFLRRLTGMIHAIYSPHPSQFDAAFEDYCSDVRGLSVAPASKGILEYLRAGEELSRVYYLSSNVDEKTLGLNRRVVFRVRPGNSPSLHSITRRNNGGQSEIILTFAAAQFAFGDFVNLPFLFFHEYLSHVHTAGLFAETRLTPSPFEDGWLLYVARDLYRLALVEGAVPPLGHALVRVHYLGKMVAAILDSPEPWVGLGYEMAAQFSVVVGPDLFKEITLIFASTPYDALGHTLPDLHHEFILQIRRWLREFAVLEHEERQEQLENLKSAASSQSAREVLSTLLELTKRHPVSGLEEEQDSLLEAESKVVGIKDLAEQLSSVTTEARTTGYPAEKLEEMEERFDQIQNHLVELADSTRAEIQDVQRRLQTWGDWLSKDPERVGTIMTAMNQLNTVRDEVRRLSDRGEEIRQDLMALLHGFERRLDDQSARLDTRTSELERIFDVQIEAVRQRIDDHLTKRGLKLAWWEVALGFIAAILTAITIYEPVIRLYEWLLGILLGGQ